MSIDIHNATKPSLFRILASMFYDVWLIAAVLLIGVIADTFIRAAMGLQSGEGNHLLLNIYWVISPLIFYAWFWIHGGQTLGMKSWKLMVLTEDGNNLTWKQAVIRFLVAIVSLSLFGLGYFWRYINADGLTWHDLASGTRLVELAKK